MFPSAGGMSLLEQKRLQWAREREEMTGLYGLWGALDKSVPDKPPAFERGAPRRNSLLPPIQVKSEEPPKEEESETSGYMSDSPQHEYESSTDSQSGPWMAKAENYWGDRKTQKNLRNERRMHGTPDSLLSTPEDRLKWGDRGVGVGHLWEPVEELPESRLPQVLEAYRATPKWLERGLKQTDGGNADILVIHHDDEERPSSNFLLGQNAPLPPEVLEERERRRRKALEHQNAIRRQLEERDRKRKEEKENRLMEERIEEERVRKQRELERMRQEEDQRKSREKENIEKRKEEAMKEALKKAEQKAKDVKRKQKKREVENEEKEKFDYPKEDSTSESDARVTEELSVVVNGVYDASPLPVVQKREIPRPVTETNPVEIQKHETPRRVIDNTPLLVQKQEMTRSVTDSGSQSEGLQSLQFLNEGVALVLEGGTTGSLLMPQETVQLLLMSPSLPVQRQEKILTPSKLRCPRLFMDATTQTDRRKCCSFSLNSVRSRRSTRASGRTSVRSDSSDKSASLERLDTHSHRRNSYKHRSRSQPRLNLGERPKWGINRPTVQYMKQSEKDPHYMRRMKRRTRKTKEAGTSTGPTEERLLDSEFRLLAFQTDEELEEIKKNSNLSVLENGFRMVSNSSSPRFVPIVAESATDSELLDSGFDGSNHIETNDQNDISKSDCFENDGLSAIKVISADNSHNDFEICVTSQDELCAEEIVSLKLHPSSPDDNSTPIVEPLPTHITQLQLDSNDDDNSPIVESLRSEDIASIQLHGGSLDEDSSPVVEPLPKECLSSEPSSSRSESNGNDGDYDDDDDDESVVTGPVAQGEKSDALGHIAALKLKKEPAQVLDLSRVKITSKEEFRKYLDKIPEYKIKPEKVLPESIKIRDKDFSFAPNRREGRVTDYNYLDPTPPDMKSVNLADLCPVSIDWKMLTTLRPKTKVEEDMFSRLVQLGKLDLKHQQQLKRAKDSDWIRRTKNPRSSIVETRVLSCKECGEDFCDGSVCCKLMYENFFRVQPSIATGVAKDAGAGGADDMETKKKKQKHRGRRRTRSVRRRKLRKNSIFNRPASRGCSRDHSRRERAAADVVAKRSSSQDRAKPVRASSPSPPARARSAPRIQFKGVDSDDDVVVRKSGYTSESAGISPSDYSTQSDSESPVRRVEFADEASVSPHRGFVRRCTLSAGGECTDYRPKRSPRYVMSSGDWSWRDKGDTTSDTDESVNSEKPERRCAPTIQLEFEPGATSSMGFRIPKALNSTKRSERRRNEVRKIVQGLSRVELALAGETKVEIPVKVRRRHGTPLSGRGKHRILKVPSSGVQGKALLPKPEDDGKLLEK